MKVYANQSNMLEASMAAMEHKDRDHAGGLKLAETFIFRGVSCGHQADRMHIKSIAIFVHIGL